MNKSARASEPEREPESGRERALVGGIELEVLRGGTGTSALLLHGFQTISADATFLPALARHCTYLAPSLPGFGASKRPKEFETVYDLSRHVLDLIEWVPDVEVTLIGFSFGGWLAAEAAAMRPIRLKRLILVDPVGIRISDRETRDILDIFNVDPDVVRGKTFFDPDRFAPNFEAMDDAALITYARNREALCLYTWNPLLYNPQLKHWLRRINVPTLVLWGADDGIVCKDYGRAYAEMIPGARFELIENAGHHPEIEQPMEFIARVARFMSGA